jgi:hypothetical protein
MVKESNTMRRLILAGMMAVVAGCASSWDLSPAERGKLQPILLALLTEDLEPDGLADVTTHPDGTKEYGVIVRCTNPEDLRAERIPVRSIIGDIITASVTREQLRRIVALPSVRWVEQGGRLEIQQ